MPGKRKSRSDVLEVESDAERESSPDVSLVENGRITRGASNTYKDSKFMREQQFQADMKDKKIQVKCNQSGKLYKTKITSLSTEEGESISADDLGPGSQIMMDYNKKSYPVTVVKVLGQSEGQSSDSTPSDGGSVSKKAKTQLSDVMKQAKQSLEADGSDSEDGELTNLSNQSTPKSTNSAPSRQKAYTHYSEIMTALAKIQSTLNELVEYKPWNGATTGAAAAVKTEDDANYIVDGVNLLQLPARDAYAYGRSLLDVLFTKEELARSVIYKTKKSDRPPLDPARVQKMFDCIARRFKDHDHAKMMTTLGQKCRDSGRGESSKGIQKNE